MRASADLHVGNLDFGEILTVPTVAAVPGPAREPENADLLVLAVPHDLGGDLGTLDVWLPALHVLPVARDQHLVERHLVARLRIEQRDLDRDSRLGAELAAAGGKYRVAHRRGTLIGMGTSVKASYVVRRAWWPFKRTTYDARRTALSRPQRIARSHRDQPAEPSS